eukprot:TRINITY_DN2996_c3_g1_i2.p1 TRINITY_DN2996_c3_g1~~TRINITY_DN2996_c3_g1_i2.p1  ORF type:complete len:324 (+),score=53.35 TRINITY_DN2996_c3_g1_i2:96-1067(+)
MATRASGTVATRYGMPTQFKPPVGRSPNFMQGQSYMDKNRDKLAGIPEVAALNERPFMQHKDTYRALTGMHSWDPDRPFVRSGNMGPPHRMKNFAEARVRAAHALKINAHPTIGFNAQVPGQAPSNPAAVVGEKVLSSKFIPLETSGDGLLFIHPNQREILSWTQDQLREDAKANGRDIDEELAEQIEEVIRQDPVQPYHDKVANRKEIMSSVRYNIIKQEMMLHQRRKKKGLPAPPMLMPQYANEYPDQPDQNPKTDRWIGYYHTFSSNNSRRRFGSFTYSLPPDEVNRMNKRRTQYVEELREQGVVCRWKETISFFIFFSS